MAPTSNRRNTDIDAAGRREWHHGVERCPRADHGLAGVRVVQRPDLLERRAGHRSRGLHGHRHVSRHVRRLRSLHGPGHERSYFLSRRYNGPLTLARFDANTFAVLDRRQLRGPLRRPCRHGPLGRARAGLFHVQLFRRFGKIYLLDGIDDPPNADLALTVRASKDPVNHRRLPVVHGHPAQSRLRRRDRCEAGHRFRRGVRPSLSRSRRAAFAPRAIRRRCASWEPSSRATPPP